MKRRVVQWGTQREFPLGERETSSLHEARLRAAFWITLVRVIK